MFTIPIPSLILDIPRHPVVAVGFPLIFDFGVVRACDWFAVDKEDPKRSPYPPIPSVLWAVVTAASGWASHLIAHDTAAVQSYMAFRLLCVTWRPLFGTGIRTSRTYYPPKPLTVAVDLGFVAVTGAAMAYQMAKVDETTLVWNAPALAWIAYGMWNCIQALRKAK